MIGGVGIYVPPKKYKFPRGLSRPDNFHRHRFLPIQSQNLNLAIIDDGEVISMPKAVLGMLGAG